MIKAILLAAGQSKRITSENKLTKLYKKKPLIPYHIDKKIKELMKVCNTIELKPPTFEQGKQILSSLIPNINNDTSDEITQFVQSDLRRMSHIYSIYENNNRKLTQEALHTIFQLKFYSEDTKNITKKLINTQATFEDHNKMMNETDRTIVGLLWHENIIDTLSKLPFNHSVRLYLKILKNICFADYIDRITFQKQIWQFNGNRFQILIWLFH